MIGNFVKSKMTVAECAIRHTKLACSNGDMLGVPITKILDSSLDITLRVAFLLCLLLFLDLFRCLGHGELIGKRIAANKLFPIK